MNYQAPTPEGTRSPTRWRTYGSRRGLSARRTPLAHVADPCAARGHGRLPGGVLLGASIGVHLPRSPVLGHLSPHPHDHPHGGVAVGRAGGSPLVTHLTHMWPPRARREGSVARPEVCFLAPRLVCTCAKRLGGTSTAKLGSGAVACVRAAPGALRSSHISHTCGRPVRGARARSQPGTSASRRRVMLLCCGVLSTTVLWCINVLRCCSTLMYYQAPTPEGT